ncbi:MAG: glycosyltransferase [Gammaproteobacteria bacterium]|nr:glycosyltransferase [Gammaproteobacteria bacterium]
MRLAFIVPGGVDRSGEQRVIPVLLALLERLARQHEVQVFALAQEPQPDRWSLRGAEVHNVGSSHPRWRAWRALVRAHRRAPFDLIQAFWSSGPGTVAYLAARTLGVPYVVHVAGGELAALRDIGYGGRLTRRGALREALVLRGAAQVTAASAPLLAALESLGVRAERLPLGVDLARWPARPPRARHPGAIAQLVQVASLNRVKDQGTLLQALACLRRGGVRCHLHLIGEDVLHGAVQRHARELGLESCVTFHGFLPQTPLREQLCRCDLMLITSRHEAGPVCLLEAALCGVPAVGTAVGHLTEWAPAAARTVAAGDAPGLAREVAAVLGSEPLRLELAAAAQARALREDADESARRFEALYARVAASRQAAARRAAPLAPRRHSRKR